MLWYIHVLLGRKKSCSIAGNHLTQSAKIQHCPPPDSPQSNMGGGVRMAVRVPARRRVAVCVRHAPTLAFTLKETWTAPTAFGTGDMPGCELQAYRNMRWPHHSICTRLQCDPQGAAMKTTAMHFPTATFFQTGEPFSVKVGAHSRHREVLPGVFNSGKQLLETTAMPFSQQQHFFKTAEPFSVNVEAHARHREVLPGLLIASPRALALVSASAEVIHASLAPWGNRTVARAWRGLQAFFGLGWRGHGAGVARAWRGHGAGVARAWRGHVLFPLA
eukprot:gene22348-biopygen19245